MRPNESEEQRRAEEAMAIYAACRDRGYKPVRIWDAHATVPGASKQPYGRRWQKSAGEEVTGWGNFGWQDFKRSDGSTAAGMLTNIGIACDGLRAIDIDVDNRRAVNKIKRLALSMLGQCPIRSRSNSPRALLLYRAAEGSPRKVVQGLGDLGKVEVLGAGQQFVAYGNHANSKGIVSVDQDGNDVLLTWEGNDPAGRFGKGRRKPPVITEEALFEFLGAVAAEFGVEAVSREKPAPVAAAEDDSGSDLPAGALRGALVDILNALAPRVSEIWENDEDWQPLGAGIRHVFGDDAYAVWHAWNEGCPDYDEEKSRPRWLSWNSEYNGRVAGWGKVKAIARKYGVTADDLERFESVSLRSHVRAMHEAMNGLEGVQKLIRSGGGAKRAVERIKTPPRMAAPDTPKAEPESEIQKPDPRIVYSEEVNLRMQAREENERIAAEGLPVPVTIKSYTSLLATVEDWWIIGMDSGAVMFNKERRKGYRLRGAKELWGGSIINEINPATGKTIPKHAFDVMLRDCHERLDGMTWDPSHGEIAPSPENPGEVCANRWLGIFPPFGADSMSDGEAETLAAPFIEHVRWLFRAEADLFLKWLAHIFQCPGKLPQTAWIHIAPKKGMGRNWIASVLVRAMRGYVAPNQHMDDLLGGSYNGGYSGKLLAVVDETTADSDDRSMWAVKAKLRTDMNPEFRRINAKYGLQWTERNCMRWLMFSNDLNAIPMDDNERRFNFSICEDSPRGPDYYSRLYAALEDKRFIAAVYRHLMALPLRGFDPGDTAIDNPARRRVVAALMHPAEMSIRDFVGAVPAEIGLFTMAGVKAFLASDYEGKALTDKALKIMLDRAGCHHVEGSFKFHDLNENGGVAKTVKSKSGVWIAPSCGVSAAEIAQEAKADVLRRAIAGNEAASAGARDGTVREFKPR